MIHSELRKRWYWTTKRDIRHILCNMKLSHIKNCINYIKINGETFRNKPGQLKILEKELHYRKNIERQKKLERILEC